MPEIFSSDQETLAAITDTKRATAERATQFLRQVAAERARVRNRVESGVLLPESATAALQELEQKKAQGIRQIMAEGEVAIHGLQAARPTPNSMEERRNEDLIDRSLVAGSLVGAAALGPAALPVAGGVAARRIAGPDIERALQPGDADGHGFLETAARAAVGGIAGSTPESRLQRALVEAETGEDRLALARQEIRRQGREAQMTPGQRAKRAAADTLGQISAMLPAFASGAAVGNKAIPVVARGVASSELSAMQAALRAARGAATANMGMLTAELTRGNSDPQQLAGAMVAATFFGGSHPVVAKLVNGQTKAAVANAFLGSLGDGVMTYRETGDLATALGTMAGMGPFTALEIAGDKGPRRRAPETADVLDDGTAVEQIDRPDLQAQWEAIRGSLAVGGTAGVPPEAITAMLAAQRRIHLGPRPVNPAHLPMILKQGRMPVEVRNRDLAEIGIEVEEIRPGEFSRHLDTIGDVARERTGAKRRGIREVEQNRALRGIVGLTDIITRRMAEGEDLTAVRRLHSILDAIYVTEDASVRRAFNSEGKRRYFLDVADRMLEVYDVRPEENVGRRRPPAEPASPGPRPPAELPPARPDPTRFEMVAPEATALRVAQALPRPALSRGVREVRKRRQAELDEVGLKPQKASLEVRTLIETGGPEEGSFTPHGERTLADAAKTLLRALAQDTIEFLGGGNANLGIVPRPPDMSFPQTRKALPGFTKAFARHYRLGAQTDPLAQMREIGHRLRRVTGLDADQTNQVMREATGKDRFRDMTAPELLRAVEALGRAGNTAAADVRNVLDAMRMAAQAHTFARRDAKRVDRQTKARQTRQFKQRMRQAREDATERPRKGERPPDGDRPRGHGAHGPGVFHWLDYVRNVMNVAEKFEPIYRLKSAVVAPIVHLSRALDAEYRRHVQEFGDFARAVQQERGTISEEGWATISDVLEANKGDVLTDLKGLDPESAEVEVAQWLRDRMNYLHGTFGIRGFIDGYVPRMEDFVSIDEGAFEPLFEDPFYRKFATEIKNRFAQKRTLEMNPRTVRDPRVWFEAYTRRGFYSQLTPELRKAGAHLERVLKDEDGEFKGHRERSINNWFAQWSERLVGIPSNGEVLALNTIASAMHRAGQLASLLPGGDRLRFSPDPADVARHINGLINKTYPGLLGLKPAIATRNIITQLPPVFALLGTRHTLAGMRDWANMNREAALSGDVREFYRTLTQGAQLERLTGVTSEAFREGPSGTIGQSRLDKLYRASLTMFDASEVMLRTVAFRGGQHRFSEAVAQGRVNSALRMLGAGDRRRVRDILRGEVDLANEAAPNSEARAFFEQMSPEEQAAFEYGRAISTKTQFLYSPELSPVISGNVFGRALFQFASYPVNVADFYLGIAGAEAPAGEKWKTMGKQMLASYALLAASEAAISIAPDDDLEGFIREVTLGEEERGMAMGRLVSDMFFGPLAETTARGIPTGPVAGFGLDAIELLLRSGQEILEIGPELASTGAVDVSPTARRAMRLAEDAFSLTVPGSHIPLDAIDRILEPVE